MLHVYTYHAKRSYTHSRIKEYNLYVIKKTPPTTSQKKTTTKKSNELLCAIAKCWKTTFVHCI